jgi:hypothetical protein
VIEYHKIDSVFKRDPETKFKTFLDEYTRPEFEYLADLYWSGTEKVDGMNIRIGLEGIGGRTDNAQIPGDLIPILLEIQQRLIEEAALGQIEDIVLIGEGYGAGIQKGGHYRDDKAFVLFDVMIHGGFLKRPDVRDIAALVGVPVVPILNLGTLPEWVNSIKNGDFTESVLHEGAQNEGVVLRPGVELLNSYGSRIITKLKFKDFQ